MSKKRFIFIDEMLTSSEGPTVVTAIDADRIVAISHIPDGTLREIVVDAGSEVVTFETPMGVSQILSAMENAGVFNT